MLLPIASPLIPCLLKCLKVKIVLLVCLAQPSAPCRPDLAHSDAKGALIALLSHAVGVSAWPCQKALTYQRLPQHPEVGNMLGVFGLVMGPKMHESGDSVFTLFVLSRPLGFKVQKQLSLA